jgi:hypothetical protein
MAASNYSFANFTGDGSTTQFTLAFPFLSRSHVKVYVDGVAKVLNTDYTIDQSTGRVTFASAPAAAAEISIYRLTPRATGDRTVVFVDPSNLKAEDLNNADLQQLYITQELLDRAQAAIRSEPSDGTPSDPLDPLPEVADRAERVLAFDEAGQPTVAPVTLTQLQLLAERNPIGLLSDVTDYGLIADGVVVASADYGSLTS